MSNFLEALTMAVAKDQTSLSRVQVTVALKTEDFAEDVMSISNYYNGPDGVLAQDAAQCRADVGKTDGSETRDQVEYQKDSAVAQSQINSANAPVQSSESETGRVSSNLQNLTSLLTTCNMIGSTTASMLAQGM